MITEKTFAESHNAFWHALLPLSDSYLRLLNRHAMRFEAPIEQLDSSNERGLTNELAFRLFAHSVNTNSRVWSEEVVAGAMKNSVSHVSTMRRYEGVVLPALSGAGIRMATLIALRILAFHRETALNEIRCFPPFLGCGWISACEGDLLSRGVLVEVKAGDRPFRAIDLRQLICYAALNFASKQYEIHTVCLLNPRRGTFWVATMEELFRGLSGRPFVEMLGAVVDYISEPFDRY